MDIALRRVLFFLAGRGIATLTIDRPYSMNAPTLRWRAHSTRPWPACATSLRCLVLCGVGLRRKRRPAGNHRRLCCADAALDELLAQQSGHDRTGKTSEHPFPPTCMASLPAVALPLCALATWRYQWRARISCWRTAASVRRWTARRWRDRRFVTPIAVAQELLVSA